MQMEQNENTAYAKYPSLRLHEQLGGEDAGFLPDIFRRQALNHSPMVTTDTNAPVQNLQVAGNANLSVMWWCVMVDAERVQGG